MGFLAELAKLVVKTAFVYGTVKGIEYLAEKHKDEILAKMRNK